MYLRVLAILLIVVASYAQVGKPVTNPPAPPKKPAMARNSTFLAQHYTSTAGKTYDFFSGMSYVQLEIVRTQWETVKQRAAQASDLHVSQGAGKFGKQADFILCLWFPTDCVRLGLPAFQTNPDRGGKGTRNISAEFWGSIDADRVGSRYGRTIDRLLSHLLAHDSVGYHRVADDHAYWVHVHLLSKVYGKPSVDVISLYLHDTIQLTTAVNYFLGSDFTPEVQSAFQTVFRFISWHLAVVVDLYNTKVYQRYEGQSSVDSTCIEVSPLDLAPAEEDYPFLSNGTMSYTYGKNTQTGPVSPDGVPLDRTMYGRADEDYGADYSPGSSSSSSAQLAPQPRASPGAPPLSPFPYSATADKPTDGFTGITYEQLAVGAAVWNSIKLAAAKATSVTDVDGDISFTKQAYYIMVQRHPEFLPAFNITNAEEIWTSTTLADRIREPYARQLDNAIVGITLRNYGLFIRSLDRAQFQHYVETRELGQAWYTLTYYTWLADAHLAAAEFFLGTSLTDEQYSAMESIFSFVDLKAYQIYHAYNKGYRARPFASDFEMVGVLLQ